MSNCDDLCQHLAEPLRVYEIKITQVSAAFKVEKNAILMEKASQLFKIIFKTEISMCQFFSAGKEHIYKSNIDFVLQTVMAGGSAFMRVTV